MPWWRTAVVDGIRQRLDHLAWLGRLLAVRRASPALRGGGCETRQAPDGVLAYERIGDADRRVVLVNFTGAPQRCPASGVVVLDPGR